MKTGEVGKGNPEKLAFTDLTPYLLLKNGNYLYKVPFRDGWAVLKVYYGSRTPLQHFKKSFENVCAGQTSYFPKTRRRIELECLELWRRHGFRVFQTFEQVTVAAPHCPPGGYTLFEYVEAPKLDACLRDTGRPLEERKALYRRFLAEWGRRHAVAIQEREPRLVHENGDGKHVLIMPDDSFLWFDFEMIYRSRRHVDLHVSHEIVQYIWYLNRNTAPDFQADLLAETAAHYPHPERLREAYRYFFRHPSPAHRWARGLERRFKGKARAPDSKYGVAQGLLQALEKSGRA
jgi:hypothetical protein